MATHIPTSLLLLFFLCSFHAMVSMATTQDVDFHYLVLMWPGSYCKKTSDGCCYPKTGKPELDFFVKGLLPYSKDGTALTHCKRSSFNMDEMTDLEDGLYSYWPSIKCPSSEGHYIWRNTWKTYGVCSGLSQHDYFKKALDLRAKINMLSILKTNGIISTDNADYSFGHVLDAVTKGVGANAAIECSKNMWGESIIYKIYVCVNNDATNVVPCPVLPSSTCASRVVLGSFTYEMLSNHTALATNPLRMRFFDE